TIQPRHAAALGLVLSHGFAGSLLDLSALVLCPDGEHPAHEFAGFVFDVEGFGYAFQIGARADEPADNVGIVGILPGQAIAGVNDERCLVLDGLPDGGLEAGPIIGAAPAHVLVAEFFDDDIALFAAVRAAALDLLFNAIAFFGLWPRGVPGI